MLKQTQKNKHRYCFLNIFIQTHLFILPKTSRNTYWIVDPFTQVKSAKYMVKSKTKSTSNLGTFSNFLLNVQSIIFSKFPHEIEAAAITLFVLLSSVGAERVSKIPEYACVHR